MYKHILAPTDGSEVAQKGVDEAVALAKALGARLLIVTVTERLPLYQDTVGLSVPVSEAILVNYASWQEQSTQALLTAARHSADAAGVAVETLLVPDTPPAEAIIETAKTRNCDLIVMASHGRRGLGRLLIGSKTAEVVAQSPVPVLVVR